MCKTEKIFTVEIRDNLTERYYCERVHCYEDVDMIQTKIMHRIKTTCEFKNHNVEMIPVNYEGLNYENTMR